MTQRKQKIDVSLLSDAEKVKILRAAAIQDGHSFRFDTLEELVCSEEGFGLVTATPLQRACCRIISGQPLKELRQQKEVVRALNTRYPLMQDGVPSEVDLIAGVRTAKSMLAAAVSIWASQTCKIDQLSPGEIPRYSVLSLSLDNARVVLGHLLGALNRPALAGLRLSERDMGSWRALIDDIGADTVGSEFLWHPCGRPVEIRIIAGKRGGGSAVSRWSLGATFDEAARMVGAGEGVINYDDARRAVRTRLLEGAQILTISSPWVAYGPIYERVKSYWGKPTRKRVVLKATGPAMNPIWWTPERCEEIKNEDPLSYRTDVCAEFADAEESMFPQILLDACTRENPLFIPWEHNHDYCAAIDPATRGNAWTLVVADRIGAKKRVVFCRQWLGSSLRPLSPRQVLEEVRDILAEYDLDWCYTDQWSADANKDLAATLGFNLIIEDWNNENKVRAFNNLRSELEMGRISLPNDRVLQEDLRRTKRVPTRTGVSIQFDKTSDGRHCDYSPAVARALYRWFDDVFDDPPEKGTTEYYRQWEERCIEQEEEALRVEEAEEWWEVDPWTPNY